MSALEYKNAGNKAFQEGDYNLAIEQFSKAIELEQNHVYYSNRSGAFCALKQFDKALEDAEKCVALNGSWPKGYSRLGAAFHGLGQLDEAKRAYEKGLQVDPSNAGLKESLEEINALQSRPRPGGMFGNPAAIAQMMTRLRSNPKTSAYLDDPAFLQNLQAFTSGQIRPDLLSDPRMQTALGVMLGTDFMGAGEGGDDDSDAVVADDDDSEASASARSARDAEMAMKRAREAQLKEQEERLKAEEAARRKAEEEAAAAAAAEEEDPELAAEKREREERRKLADEEKTKGTEAYKQKNFEVAMEHYKKAFEIDDSNAVYPLNMSAVHFETGDYDACIEACELALKVDSSSRVRLDAIQKSRVYLRLGNAYAKKNLWTEAISAYKRSILENNSQATRDILRKAEASKRKYDDEAYLDPAKSEEAKLAGNEKFSQGQYPEAIELYNEALKRNPDNYKVYSNRANCYAKLMQWDRALEDCDKCLSRDPAFIKAYIRKGKIQHLLKQFPQAISTFQKGLEFEPNNAELIEGLVKTKQSIAESNRSGEVDQQRMEASMRDPEVRAIMMDPIINQVLQDLKENPSAAQNALRDPSIVAKIEKLEAAGIVRFG